MSSHTFQVLAALAEFLAAISIVLCIWMWLTQKKNFPSDELNRTAVGHRVHTTQAPSGEDEASIKAIETLAPTSPNEPDDSGTSADSSDNRSVEIDPNRPRPIQRPE